MPDRLRARLTDQLWPIVEGAKHCLNLDLRTPSLILVYSGIDVAGWIHSRDPKGQDNHEPFTTWTERYLKPEHRFGCSALDLWGARCGMLHRSSPDSHWAESGEVRRILYSWGEADPADLQKAADELHPDDYVAIHIDDLVDGFRMALMSFLEGLDGLSRERRTAVRAKSRRVFADMPREPLDPFLDGLDERGGV